MIKEYLPHLLEKIDIIFMADITLMGFMIAALSILKLVIPKDLEEEHTLKIDILNIFKYALWFLLASTVFSIIAFFFYKEEFMQYFALVSFILFLISLLFIYKSVSIIFTLEKWAILEFCERFSFAYFSLLKRKVRKPHNKEIQDI